MISAYLAGLSLGLSLILAIGAQNAFVLKQGLKKQHVFPVCLVCAISDAFLVAVGVSGFGLFVEQAPWVAVAARYGGAAFLGLYAAKSFVAAMTTKHVLNPAGETVVSLSRTLAVCLALTWLNPHVYLDTVVLLGSISTQYTTTRLSFASGAITASFLFFFGLGYGARVLIPFFQKPQSWKILEFGIGVIMTSIAFKLLMS